MSGAVLFLLVLVASLCSVLFAFVLWVIHLLNRVYTTANGSHANCIAEIREVVSPAWTAAVLRNLADEYDAIENQAVLVRLRRGVTGYAETPTVPALWLRAKADEMDPL